MHLGCIEIYIEKALLNMQQVMENTSGWMMLLVNDVTTYIMHTRLDLKKK